MARVCRQILQKPAQPRLLMVYLWFIRLFFRGSSAFQQHRAVLLAAVFLRLKVNSNGGAAKFALERLLDLLGKRMRVLQAVGIDNHHHLDKEIAGAATRAHIITTFDTSN